MIFESVRVQNFRSIADTGTLLLGQVTVLIGPNNSGKSALLRAALLAQGGAGFDPADVRYGTNGAVVDLRLARPYPPAVANWGQGNLADVPDLTVNVIARDPSPRIQASWSTDGSQAAATGISIPAVRPLHLIVPVLTGRRATHFETAVRRDTANLVGLNDRALASRLQALAGGHTEGNRYRRFMREILSFDVSTYVAGDGLLPGVQLSSSAGIDLERMGDGVRSVVTLASELADQEQSRLFIIEEPENDLHPEALIALLGVIRRSSRHHQFLVSTHSEVVLRELGADPTSAVYEARSTVNRKLSTTTYTPLSDEFERRAALASLGYTEPLPIAWLIFEESTAQSFVRDCLIPMFAPRLAAANLVSADGAGNLPRTVEGLHRMVLFARLAVPHEARAWVLADGDKAGREAIGKLRAAYKGWPPSRFETFARTDIEAYYPATFANRVARVTGKGDGRKQQALKGALVTDVIKWSLIEPDARAQLATSAADVIDHLQRIEREIVAMQSATDTPEQTSRKRPGVRSDQAVSAP